MLLVSRKQIDAKGGKTARIFWHEPPTIWRTQNRGQRLARFNGTTRSNSTNSSSLSFLEGRVCLVRHDDYTIRLRSWLHKTSGENGDRRSSVSRPPSGKHRPPAVGDAPIDVRVCRSIEVLASYVSKADFEHNAGHRHQLTTSVLAGVLHRGSAQNAGSEL